MYTILAVKKLASNYLIITNRGEYKFNEDVLVKFIIVKNREFSDLEFEEILNFKDENNYYNKALNYLRYHDRTISEMVTYLKGCSYKDKIVDKLLENNLLNDERYTKNYFDYCVNNFKGPNLFKQDLIKKEIDHFLIEDFLIEYTKELEVELIEKIILKEVEKEKKLNFYKFTNSLKNKLMRKGFNISTVDETIKKKQSEIKNCLLEEDALVLEIEKMHHKNIPKDKITKKLLTKGYKYSEIKEKLAE